MLALESFSRSVEIAQFLHGWLASRDFSKDWGLRLGISARSGAGRSLDFSETKSLGWSWGPQFPGAGHLVICALDCFGFAQCGKFEVQVGFRSGESVVGAAVFLTFQRWIIPFAGFAENISWSLFRIRAASGARIFPHVDGFDLHAACVFFD